MTGESLPNFLFRAQSELLMASLSDAPEEANKQRSLITKRFGQIFVELVDRLDLPLVLEIGAHKGNFFRKVKELRPDARVVAFEAHPLVYARHALEMKRAGVEYIQSCVADQQGEMILKVPKRDDCEKFGKGSLLHNTKEGSVAEYPVRAVTLDGFLGDVSNLANAMWIDVEGALALVFDGAGRTLRNCQALYVEMESSARWEGQMIDTDVVSSLSAYGLKPVLRDIQKTCLQYNAIFVR